MATERRDNFQRLYPTKKWMFPVRVIAHNMLEVHTFSSVISLLSIVGS